MSIILTGIVNLIVVNFGSNANTNTNYSLSKLEIVINIKIIKK